MSMNELFATNSNVITANARSLPGTQELTTLSMSLARNIIKAMEADIETYKPRIQSSAMDAKEMDAIIKELCAEYDAEFLKELPDETIDSLLKSQQSKRSRAKSKQMTLDNYMTLMTAAVAETIIRDTTGRVKSAGTFGRTAGPVDYTGAQLEELAANQEALRREIRNVQSKKSIMKSKADFDETDERWQALLKAEQQLKDLRIGSSSTHIVEVDKTKDALNEILTDTDISKLNSKDAHELLTKIQQLVVEVPAE